MIMNEFALYLITFLVRLLHCRPVGMKAVKWMRLRSLSMPRQVFLLSKSKVCVCPPAAGSFNVSV